MGLAHRNYKSLIAIRLRLNYQNCFIQKYCIVVYLKDLLFLYKDNSQAKRKYRGMFETQKSENKTRSGEICLDIRTHASPKSGTGPGVRRSKRPLLANRTRCTCSMETSHN